MLVLSSKAATEGNPQRRNLLLGGGKIHVQQVSLPPEQMYDEMEVNRPFGGECWWNAMYWTNFVGLPLLDPERMAKYANLPVYKGMSSMNSDGKLGEQFISFAAAREDLCLNAKAPKGSKTVRAECVSYDGQRAVGWIDFPLQHYLPLRNNHMPYQGQGRRCGDAGVVTFGLSAQDFSDKVMPLENVEAYITPKDVLGNRTWDYNHMLLTIAGWPFRIKKLGTHEPGKGIQEFTLGHQGSANHYEEMFAFMEGGPVVTLTGPNMTPELKSIPNKSKLFYAQLYELDWLGDKMDTLNLIDSDVAPEKGYIWFTVQESMTHPTHGMKALKVELSPEGVIPAWLDLNCLQLWAGTIPLGFLNEATAEDGAQVTVNRVLEKEETVRKIVASTEACKIVFNDPKTMTQDDMADLGWAIRDSLKQGCEITTGPRPGKWVVDVGVDEGNVINRAAAPKLVPYNEKEFKYWGFP